MKITINLKELKKLLKTIGKSTESGKIFFRVYDDSNFDIINSNLDKVIKYKYRKDENVDTAVHDTFEVDSCISNVVEKMTGDSSDVVISINKKDDFINFTKGSLKAKMSVNRGSIFNDMDESVEGKFLTYIRKDILNEAFNKVISAVSKSNSIPDSLKVLCFRVNGEDCMSAATDNSRFYTYNFKLNSNDFVDQDLKYVIPSKNVLEAMRVFSSVEDELCELADYEDMLMFKFQDVDLCINVYSQGFKDFDKIIKYINSDYSFTIDGKEFKDILSPVLAFASSQIFTSTVKLEIDGDVMKIMSVSDRGKMEDSMTIENNSAPSRTIIFNGNILNDVIQLLCGSKITFTMDKDEIKPIKVTNEENMMLNVVTVSQESQVMLTAS